MGLECCWAQLASGSVAWELIWLDVSAALRTRVVGSNESVFGNNDCGNLVVTQRKGPKTPGDVLWTKMSKQTGIVRNLSSIVAMQYQGLVRVQLYAVKWLACVQEQKETKFARADHRELDQCVRYHRGPNPVLKRLSPTVKPLKHDIPIGAVASLAGTVSHDYTQGWLFFLTPRLTMFPSTDEKDDTIIAEYSLEGTTDPIHLEVEPDQNTYLTTTC
ncbi:hypothetical protein GQ44DRAFT_734078 [Phaeosphaeriaceae sp. PMI808]|nr:hypothetical protein GQ44DRAFT_734078 [Phaeosphaeriaceae sp. PMI808]